MKAKTDNRTRRLLLLGVIGMLSGGCGPQNGGGSASSEPPARSGPPRGPAPKRSLDQIGKSAFGSSLRGTRKEGKMAQMEFAPDMEQAAGNNFKRILGTTGSAAPMVFRSEPGVQTLRLSALDQAQPTHRLAVWTISRADSDKIDWSHGVPVAAILKVVKIESLDPAFRPYTSVGGR